MRYVICIVHRSFAYDDKQCQYQHRHPHKKTPSPCDLRIFVEEAKS